MLNTISLWLVTIGIVASFYVPFYVIDSNENLLRYGLFLLGLALSGSTLFIGSVGERLIRFLKEATQEIKKVVWPSKDETVKLTGVVCLFVSVVTIILWVLDFFLGYLLDLVAL